jgi:hypothetical protein
MGTAWSWTLLAGVALAAALVAGCRPAPPPPAGEGTPVRPVSQVIEAHAPELMAIPGVVGVYEGQTARGEPCVRVMVTERTPALDAKLPRRLEGHPVEIESGGPIRPLEGSR